MLLHTGYRSFVIGTSLFFYRDHMLSIIVFENIHKPNVILIVFIQQSVITFFLFSLTIQYNYFYQRRLIQYLQYISISLSKFYNHTLKLLRVCRSRLWFTLKSFNFFLSKK